MAKDSFLNKTNHFTTEREGWRPYFEENEGFSGLTLHEVLERGNMDFQAIKVPTKYTLPGSDLEYYSKAFSIVRADTGLELGNGFTGELDNDGRMVDSGYTVVQHEEALADIFSGVLDTESAAVCVNAIEFNHGAKIAISFRMPDEFTIDQIKGDIQRMYLNFFNSFDGTDGVGGSWFGLRPVCQNTFKSARHNGIKGYFTRHTKNVRHRLQFKAGEVLGLARREFEELGEEFAKWAKIKVSDETLNEFLMAMHPDTGTGNQGPANRREFLYENIANGELVDPNDLTVWNLFNGVTKRENWYRTEKREDNAQQFEYALNGTGAANMNDAANWLRKLVG